jgi:hypothetical protein
MNGWHFTRTAEGWRWTRLSSEAGPASACSRAFESLPECLNDAARNGYRFGAPAQNLPLPFREATPSGAC